MIEQTKQHVEEMFRIKNGYKHDAKVRYKRGCDEIFVIIDRLRPMTSRNIKLSLVRNYSVLSLCCIELVAYT